jgi:pyruvate dehydrogenase E2 component (dihydrolipoamide acetyltransferase)
MDVEVFDGGTILKIVPGEGDAVPLGGLIAIIGDAGEDISSLLDSDGGATSDSSASNEPSKEVEQTETTVSAAQLPTAANDSTSSDGRIKASPLAKKIAEEKGIDLQSVAGSGPEGRIVKKDVENVTSTTGSSLTRPGAPSSAPVSAPSFSSLESREVKVSQMRKVIAKRLSESKFSNPHFYETIDIDMKAAVEARTLLKDKLDVKVSFNDIVVKASAIALSRHQAINSSWMGDVIVEHGDVHIAVAVAIDEGLMTPVIRHVDKKGLLDISSETRALAGLARDRKLTPEQMEGSTFTISNLGMFGIEEFTAIINPPNACILAVGAIRDVPVIENGAVVPGKRMKVTLSSDHRIVDGAKAAEFLNTLRSLIENPLSMLL